MNHIVFGYWTEIDTLPKLKSEGVAQYQDMVGLLRWEVDLGRVDILLETAIMSTYLALPHRGHLEHIFHLFWYLKANHKRKLFFDPQHPTIYEHLFDANDCY